MRTGPATPAASKAPPASVAIAAGRLAQIGAGQLGLVTRRQAVKEAGCSDRMLAELCRSGVLERVRRGVYRWRSTQPTFEQAALAACLATSTAVASHVTAMWLYGYRPKKQSRHGKVPLIHVSALHGREQPVQPGVRVHHARALFPAERRVRDGAPVTSPIRTLKDLAGMLPRSELEDFIGHLMSQRLLVASDLRRLHQELSTRSGSGRAGSAKLRLALVACGLDGKTATVLEQRVRRLLRQAGLPEPVAQHPIFDEQRRFVGRPDFAFVAQKIVLEADSYRWHTSPKAFAHDRRRGNRLEHLGWKVLRVTAADVTEGLPELIVQLRSLLGDAATGTVDGAPEGAPCRIA